MIAIGRFINSLNYCKIRIDKVSIKLIELPAMTITAHVDDGCRSWALSQIGQSAQILTHHDNCSGLQSGVNI